MKPRNCGTTNQRCRCASTIWFRLNEPACATTPMSERPMNTSYASICADARKLPSNAYLLFDAQPASATLYTPNDDIARKNNTPTSRSATSTPGANGITANDINADITMNVGAITKIGLSAKGGIQSSLKKILIMSAMTWPNPNGP